MVPGRQAGSAGTQGCRIGFERTGQGLWLRLPSGGGFLRKWVPTVLGSPAYQKDGMLIITSDEAAIAGPDADFRACCGEQEPGGGRVGALIVSRFVKARSVNDHPYNHYALLRSIEDLFGLSHLGFAERQGLKSFGDDVYNQPHP